ERDDLAKKRVRQLLGMNDKDKDKNINLSHYNLGKVRTL
ncbi:MAG: hypothetical protein Barrevirus17_12, partial [Barrevirus sp.]